MGKRSPVSDTPRVLFSARLVGKEAKHVSFGVRREKSNFMRPQWSPLLVGVMVYRPNHPAPPSPLISAPASPGGLGSPPETVFERLQGFGPRSPPLPHPPPTGGRDGQAGGGGSCPKALQPAGKLAGGDLRSPPQPAKVGHGDGGGPRWGDVQGGGGRPPGKAFLGIPNSRNGGGGLRRLTEI